MVTAVPSGSERPSTTTLPPIMVPEAICIREWYPTACEECKKGMAPLLDASVAGAGFGTPPRLIPTRRQSKKDIARSAD
jgi:hypothetical protein